MEKAPAVAAGAFFVSSLGWGRFAIDALAVGCRQVGPDRLILGGRLGILARCGSVQHQGTEDDPDYQSLSGMIIAGVEA